MQLMSSNEIRDYIKFLIASKMQFTIQEKRKNVSVFIDGKLTAKQKHERNDNMFHALPFNKGIQFIGMVKRQLSTYLKKQNDKIELIPPADSYVIHNLKLWNKLETGSEFLEIDLSHAYFQTMHKLGYISDNFYNKYKDKKEYKFAYIYSLSFLRAYTSVYEFNEGVCSNKYKDMANEKYGVFYDNVRYHISNTIYDAYKTVKNDCIGTVFDAIMIPKGLEQNVINSLDSNQWLYKIIDCKKVNDHYYMKQGRQVQFISPSK